MEMLCDCDCKRCTGKFSPLLILWLSLDDEGLAERYSILYDGIFCCSYLYSLSVEGVEIKIEAIEIGIKTVSLFFITELTCHVVTSKIAIHVSYTVLKYKTDADIKEVIRLDIFTKLNLLLTKTLHLHSGRWWPIVCTPVIQPKYLVV